MTITHKNLSHLFLFCQVVEAGNLTAGSKITGCSVPTLSRTIAHLETEIGEKLIHRNAKHFQLTQVGESYYLNYASQFANIQQQWQQNQQQQSQLAGKIHIACTVPFAELFLQQQAIKFMSQHPKTSIKVSFAQDTHNFIDNQVDIAIVNFPPVHNQLIQKRLFSVP